MRRPTNTATPVLTTAATPVTAGPVGRVGLLAVVLVLGTMVLYWPTTRCDFVNFDDSLYLTSNVQVQKGLTWEGLKWACFNPVCWNWHPLTVWSHMLARQLFGWNPWGHHLVNVILHAVNTGLVFLLLRRMTGALWRSALVAVLFGWHPLHVESVAWVAERKDVLSGLFGLLSLMAYARYAEDSREKGQGGRPKPEAGDPGSVAGGRRSPFNLPSAAFYLLSLLFLALGLMSKPMLVTWPFVMLLLDYWPLRRFEPSAGKSLFSTALRLVSEKIPFFVLAALVSVVTFLVQQRGGILLTAESLPLGARVGNALISYCRYLGKLFWPADLAVFYPHPGYWPLGKVLLAAGALLGISALVWVRRRRQPYLLVGWLWYCGTLVPVSQMVQTANMAMSDRWTYLPSLGALVVVLWAVWDLTRNWRHRTLALSVAGSAAVVLCLALTRHQIGYWKDSETLFRHALNVTERNWFVHNHLGAAYYKKGQMDEAIRQYQEALRWKPAYAEAHNNLGMAFSGKGQLDEAVRQLEEALRAERNYAEAHNNLGLVFLQQSRAENAIGQFKEAIRLKPDLAEAHYNLGAAFAQKGQWDEAAREFQEAVRLQPGYPNAHYQLGVALGRKGQVGEAIGQYQEAIRLKPDYAEAYSSLGILFYQQSRTDEAIRVFQEAVRLRPDQADAHSNLGAALYSKGHLDEAIRQFQEALRLKPDSADVRKNLEAVLAAKARSSPPSGASTNR
jgi:protein O-mannosyl-transferase